MTDFELKETYKNKWIKTEWRLPDNTLMETIYFYVLDVKEFEEFGNYYVLHGHKYLTPERDNKFCPIYTKYVNIAVTIDRVKIVDESEVIQRLSDDKAKINTYMEKITDDILFVDDESNMKRLSELAKYDVSKYGETLAPPGYVYSSDEVEELVSELDDAFEYCKMELESTKATIESLEKELEKYKNMPSQEAYDLFIDKWCKELKND